MKRDNPNNPEMREILRRLAALESASPLESSSVSNGRLRFIGGLLRVDSGGRVEIVGTLEIDGTTRVTGTFKVTGPWSLDGDGTISGDVTISGTVALTGDMNVTGDINVTGSGRVKVGNMVLDPSSNGGSMKFGSGPEVYASGSMLALYSGALNGGNVELAPGSAKMSNGGTRWIEVASGGLRLVGVPKVAKAGVPVGCFYKGTDGYVYEG